MFYIFLLTKILLSFLGYNENKTEKIKLANKYFPDAELIWNKSFEGKMTDFAIAEKSGHVVIGSVKDKKGYVYLFSQDGKLLWMKENVKHSKIKKCAGIKLSVSDSAETIGIFWWGGYEQEEVQIYDKSGEKLYAHKHGMIGAGVEVSPKGGYVKHVRLLDKTGKNIVLREILKGLPIEKLKYKAGNRDVLGDVRNFEFVSENEIAIRLDNILYLYSFPEGELKWSRELEGGGGKITSFEKYILLSGGKKVYCFDKLGSLLWEKELDQGIGFPQIVSISKDEKYVGFYQLGTNKGILILDFETGEIKFTSSNLESSFYSMGENMLCLKSKIFLSGYTGGYVKDAYKGYWTYIIHFDENWNILDKSWEKGLVMGISISPIIGVYESDATGKTKSGYDEGVIGYENSTIFSINVLKIKD